MEQEEKKTQKKDLFKSWSDIKMPLNKQMLDDMARWTSNIDLIETAADWLPWFNNSDPQQMFADRITDVPKSFIREILKVAISKEVISFAGGLPNRELFPVEELQKAANQIFEIAGKEILQYSNTEGYLPLRQYIADRYKEKKGLDISPDNILITNGSQQGLDLMAKTFLNEGDKVIIEEPGYLGAIQSFAVYKAKFKPVPLTNDGLDIKKLRKALRPWRPKLLYMVPNFNNPTGISYSLENRKQVADTLRGKPIYLIEDDPYGDLRYTGHHLPSFKSLLPEQTIMLGSFSKTAVPSFRTGWIVAPDKIMDRLIVAKQASDLHTNYFTQRLLHQYLLTNNIDDHITKISAVYGTQCLAMIDAIKQYFPADVSYTLPEGGMFLWVTLPKGISAMKLFDIAIKKNVAFVPGNPFYTNHSKEINTLRLNYSCMDEATIYEGIKRLAESIEELLRK